jgi:arsenate reductase
MKPKLLVLCTGNSARSQMAEGLFRRRVGDRFEVYSAGVDPKPVRPEAVAVMAEAGIDISEHRSKAVDELPAGEFAYVITVCDNARESCPVFPGAAERVHWSLEDPAGAQGGVEQREAVFRRVRDEIAGRVEQFAAQRGW